MSLDNGSPSAAVSIRCGGCGHTHSHSAWRALPTVRTLTGVDVHPHVIAWPSDCQIEVRECSGCGRSIARTSRALANVG